MATHPLCQHCTHRGLCLHDMRRRLHPHVIKAGRESRCRWLIRARRKKTIWFVPVSQKVAPWSVSAPVSEHASATPPPKKKVSRQTRLFFSSSIFYPIASVICFDTQQTGCVIKEKCQRVCDLWCHARDYSAALHRALLSNMISSLREPCMTEIYIWHLRSTHAHTQNKKKDEGVSF